MTTSVSYSESNDSPLTVPASPRPGADLDQLDLSLAARGASPDPDAARPPREFKSIPQPQNNVLTIGMKSNGNYSHDCEVAAPTQSQSVLFVCFVLYILPRSISSQYTIVQSSKYSKPYNTDILASCSSI